MWTTNLSATAPSVTASCPWTTPPGSPARCWEPWATPHAHAVVHRDIKPENILLEGGPAPPTETGFAVGTPSYMSPEQATATRELDGRSELYALGCVLYEMLAGQPPFQGQIPSSSSPAT